MMGLLSRIVLGLAVGWVKQRITPAPPGTFVITLVLAMVGALVGGYITSWFHLGNLADLNMATLLAALAGALLMLLMTKKYAYRK